MKPNELEQIVRSASARSAVERLDIYANMYFFRILDVLRDDCSPSCAPLVGDGAVSQPGHRLSAGAIRRAIRRCATSARGCRRSSPRTRSPERPWLAELARLEWARHDVFDAGDATPLDARRAARAAARRVRARCRWRSSRRTRASSRATASKRCGRRSPTASSRRGPNPLATEDGTLLVWRRHGDVVHRTLDAREASGARRGRRRHELRAGLRVGRRAGAGGRSAAGRVRAARAVGHGRGARLARLIRAIRRMLVPHVVAGAARRDGSTR